MIAHLRHNEIDKEAWDALHLRCSNRIWYMQSWVLDLCCPQWEALVDEANGAIMPLIHRTKFGVDYLYQPYAVQQQGVFSPRPSAELSDAFLQAVPKRFKYWDIHLNEAMRTTLEKGDRVKENVQQFVDLQPAVEELRAAYSQGHRRNLRKSGSDTIKFRPDLSSADFVSLFERTTAVRFGGIPAGGMELLRAMIKGAMERQQCQLIGADHDGRLVAAVCLMNWEGRIILLKSANDADGQQVQAMFHLMDHIISNHAGSELILDLAGSNTASVARFNAGFGARSTVYLHLVRNRLPAPLRWIKR